MPTKENGQTAESKSENGGDILNALMSSPIGIYVVQDGVIVLSNTRFQETTGYSEEELMGSNPINVVVAEDQEQAKEKAIAMLRKERTASYRFRVTTKTGAVKWIMESVASINYKGKRAVLGNFMDITEIEQFRASFVNSPVGIYMVQDGKIIFTNKKYQEIIGLTEDELIGVYSLNVVYPDDRDRVRDLAVKMLKGERSESYQYRVLDKVGDFKWISETVAPVHHQGRQAVLGYFMDVTDSRLIDDVLKQA